MRPIDADKLFDRIFAMLDDTEIEVRAVGKFMDLVNTAPTITPPPNDPLTLEELLGMDDEPAYIESRRHGGGYCIVSWHGVNRSWMYFSKTGTAEGMTAVPIVAREYGETWLAYRRKPEEVQR